MLKPIWTYKLRRARFSNFVSIFISIFSVKNIKKFFKKFFKIPIQERTIKKQFDLIYSHFRQRFNLDYAFDVNVIYYLNNKPAILNKFELWKIVIQEFGDILRSLQPKSILEIGSGTGKNILSLAAMLDIDKCVGLDLAENGVRLSKELTNDPPLDFLGYLTMIDKEKIREKLKNTQIEFVQGDMRDLSMFPDNSFDVVFSYAAIELISQDYDQVFKEVYRVTKKYAVFYEGFNEYNSMIQQIYRRRKNYFMGDSTDVSKAGFKLINFYMPQVSGIKTNNSFLIAMKRPADS